MIDKDIYVYSSVPVEVLTVSTDGRKDITFQSCLNSQGI